ncbi:MAG: D-glycerate dehydrogenase [Elusimicrobia bacterium]|nr:D-glycerate dehydrogenase [Elusimicrobiota bacterium]
MKKFNIYITRKIPEIGLKLIQKECGGYQINSHNRVLKKQELIKAVKDQDALLCLLTDKIDKEVILAAGPKLKVISAYSAGYENIDLKTATEKRIVVTNTPGVLSIATAETAWALMLAAARKIVDGDLFMRKGKFKGWDPLLFLGQEISGKTLGIIGAGRIGTEFGLMSKGFRMNVLYNSNKINNLLKKEINAKKVSLKALLKKSDMISLHLPLNSKTYHLIGKKELALMKPTAILINTARGPVIDENALVMALKNKKIFSAGLDVYENEPELALGLSQLPNVVLAAHIGSATTQTREEMARLAAENLILALKRQKPKNCVNPEVLE